MYREAFSVHKSWIGFLDTVAGDFHTLGQVSTKTGVFSRGVAWGSRVSQGYVPRLTCLARWDTSPWRAFPRCGGTPRPGGSAIAGRWAAGDAKRLALPRPLAYYRLNKERDQRASAAGADDRSSPATWGLRLVGTR
jgi:hypothetical protein